MKNKNLGSNFDDFLNDEKLLENSEAVAVKRVVAYQLEQEMKKKKITKVVLAQKLKTSRASLDRLLDPHNTSITLNTIERVVKVLGKKIRISIV